MFKPNSEDYCRSARLSTADAGGTADQVHSESIKFQTGSANVGVGDTIAVVELNNGVEFNLSGLDQDEVRSELKRLYTQLYLYKSKSLKNDNPHIHAKNRTNKHHKAVKSSSASNRRFSSANNNTNNKNLNTLNNSSTAFATIRENESTLKTPDESICSNDVNMHHSVSCSEER